MLIESDPRSNVSSADPLLKKGVKTALTDAHNSDDRQADLLKVQLSIYIDLYKSHFDLFLKASTIYLAVVAGLAVSSNKADDLPIRCALSVMVSIASIVGFLGGQLYKEWLISVEESIGLLSNKLGVPPIGFIQTKKMIRIEQFVSVLILVASLTNTIALLIRG